MCEDLGMRIPLAFWSGGYSAAKAWLGPCWSPPEDDTLDMQAAVFSGHPCQQCRPSLKPEDIPTGSPGRSQLPPPSLRKPGPGSHPPRPKGEKLNQLRSEADSQEAKNTPTSGSVLTPAPSSLIQVKLHFYTQSHNVLFHFFFPIK